MMAKTYEQPKINAIAIEEDVIKTSLGETGGEQGLDATMTWWQAND